VALTKRGEFWFGKEAKDIHEFLKMYSENGYKVEEFRLASCKCSGQVFLLYADDTEGAAKRVCVACDHAHFVGDSEEYWDEADPDMFACPECEGEHSNIGVGFAFYQSSEDIRWLYVGCRCVDCGLVGVFADWKIDYSPSKQLLEQV